MKTVVAIILVSISGLNLLFGQPPTKFLDKVRKDFTCLIYGREHDIGNFLSWKAFKASKVEEFTGKGASIMMLGSAAYLQNKLKEKYPDFKVEVINSKSSYQIKFTFGGNTVDIFRRMVLAEQWKDDWAYQRPENYYLIYAFNPSDYSNHKDFLSFLINFYKESAIPYTSEFDSSYKPSFKPIPQTKSDDKFVTLNIYDIGTFYNSDLGHVQYDLTINDSIICTVQKNFPQTIKLKNAGDIVISAKNRYGISKVPISLEFGREYYIRCGISASNIGRIAFKGKPKLHLVIEDYGRNEFQDAINRSKE